nr:hypothetical protein [Rhodopirellula sp. SM50]
MKSTVVAIASLECIAGKRIRRRPCRPAERLDGRFADGATRLITHCDQFDFPADARPDARPTASSRCRTA